MELEKARARIDLGLSSRRLELEKMGFSQGEIESLLESVKEEQEEEAESLFGVTGKGKFQNMRGGVPEVRAKKVSDTVGQKQTLGSPE